MIKKMSKRINIIALFVAGTMVLGACGMDSGNIEQEVSQALQQNAEVDAPEPEEEEVVEPESALEYVDVDEPDASAMTDPALDYVPMEISVPDEQGNTETHKEVEEASLDDDVLQIVFMGDSIFDSVRDDTGIASQVGDILDADVYNLAIGGTTAALRRDKSTDFEHWSEPSFLGVLYTMEGKITNGLLNGYKSGEVMATLNPEATDYFIIEYGTNDFLWYIPMGTDNYNGAYHFYYRSALDMGVSELQDKYPNAKIILCTPYYEEYWAANKTRYLGDCHVVNNGFGTLLDYISVMKDVARDHDLPYLDMYDLLGIDQNNVNDMTLDGIHPSEVARQRYAECLSNAIKQLEKDEFNQEDFDPQ